jgi:nuclear pore complex protein Nup98-Nup96
LTFATTAAAFGQQQSPVGTTVKFNPPTGTDTMMKSDGQQQNINTQHQCITLMKEYTNKSIEEIRFEDYSAKRKGPAAGATVLTVGGGSLFGAAQSSTGLFAEQPQQKKQQQGGMFGQQNKPLLRAATTLAFGMPTASPLR